MNNTIIDIKKILLLIILSSNVIYAQEETIDTTLKCNNLVFQIKKKTISSELILFTSTLANQTALIDTLDGRELAYIKYPDFNEDGNPDILLNYFGNNSMYSLYLFNPKTNTFMEVENYIEFPDAVQLKLNSKYYYSYRRAGCADMNWVSDLFSIQDFKITHLGHIEGEGCDFQPQIIKIYKILNNNKENSKLIKKLPYSKYIFEFGDKWSFINEYWNNNYSKFENKKH